MVSLFTITIISIAIAALLVVAFYWWTELDFPSIWGLVLRTLGGAVVITPLALWMLTGEFAMMPEMTSSAPRTSQAPSDAGADSTAAQDPSGGKADPDDIGGSRESTRKKIARRAREEAQRQIDDLAAEASKSLKRRRAEKDVPSAASPSDDEAKGADDTAAEKDPTSPGIVTLPKVGVDDLGARGRSPGSTTQDRSYSRSYRRPEGERRMAMPPKSAAPSAAPSSPPVGGNGSAVAPSAAAPAPEAEANGEPPVAAAEAESEDWSIVPVFYGTDRERKGTSADTSEEIDYDWRRGRRLELGRALVTVPKDHVVPMVERPWAIRIPYIDVTLYEAEEDPKKHFTINELKALTREEFLALVRTRLAASERFEDHALVFVHGYKTTFENAVYRTAQISYDLKFDGAPFLYSWPSGGTLQGYTYDRESAAQAEPYLRQFLEMVVNETQARKVSIIAHSMGNQLLLRVLQDLKRSLPEGVLISQLVLAAPDVDRDSFENIVGSIRGIAEGITLYSAANDQALLISRRVNGGIPRAGDVPDDGPIIVEGVDTIDATASSMDSIGINHSGYAENNALLEDIGRLISSGLRPPEKRMPTLERVTIDRGTYWRYPAIVPDVVGKGQ